MLDGVDHRPGLQAAKNMVWHPLCCNLALISKGQHILQGFGFSQLRVRCEGDTARIELLPADLVQLLKLRERQELESQFLTLDLTAVSASVYAGSGSRCVSAIADGVRRLKLRKF